MWGNTRNLHFIPALENWSKKNNFNSPINGEYNILVKNYIEDELKPHIKILGGSK